MNKPIAIEELEAIIELCKVHKEVIEFKDEITPEIQQIATKNGVGAWIYSRCKAGLIKGIDTDHLKQWKRVYFHNTLQYQKYIAVYQKVNEQLAEMGIPILALKGIALASELYADEGLRPMSDIDILVPEGSGSEALHVLLKNGAQQLGVPRSSQHEQLDAHVRAISIDGIMVEIHQRLFSMGSVFYLKGTDRFENCVQIKKQGIAMQRLNDVLMAYHLVTHAIKGIQMGGLRLGWLLDIALVLQPIKDREAFILAVINVNRKQEKAMRQLIQMAVLLLPNEASIPPNEVKRLLSKIAALMEVKDLGPKHRLINLYHLFNAPGLRTKATVLWREFFPEREYMQYRYQTQAKEPLWRLYAKRIVRW